MADKTLSITVRAGDQATTVLRNINTSVLNIGISVDATKAKAVEFGDKFESSLGRIKEAIAAVFAYELLKKGVETLLATAETIDQIAKAARRLGVDGQELSILKYQADIAGVGFEGLGTSLKFAEKNLSQFVDTGKGKYEAWADKFKIDLVDEKGHLKDVIALLPQFADKFNQLSPGQATQAASDIFGKQGSSMLQLFRLGGEEMQRLSAEARTLNVAFTSDQLSAAERMVDATKRVGAAWLGVKTSIMTAVEPAITPLLNSIAQKMAALPDITRTIGDNLAKALHGDADAYQKVHEFVASLLNVAEQGVIEGGKLLFTTIVVTLSTALRLAFVAIEPDLKRVGKDFLFEMTGGKLGAEDVISPRIRELSAKIKSMMDAMPTADSGLTNLLAKGPLDETGRAFQAQVDTLKTQLAAAKAEFKTLTQGPADDVASEFAMGALTLDSALKTTTQNLQPYTQRLSAAAEAMGKIKENVDKHSLATEKGPSPIEKLGDDSDVAAPKVGKVKFAVEELANMMQELQARQMAVGDDKSVERVRLQIQQRKEILQVTQQLGGVAYGYVFNLKQVQAEELKAFDVNTQALDVLRNLDDAEKGYKISLEDRTDAVATGALTQQQANQANRASLQAMLDMAVRVRDNIASLQEANPELATKLMPQLEKAAQAVSSVRRSLTAIPENNVYAGATAALRDLRNEADDFYKVSREGTQQLVTSFSSGLAGAIVAVISGTQSFGKAMKTMLANVLQQVSQLILQFLILRAIMGIAGAFSGASAPTMTTGVASEGVTQIPDLAGPGVGLLGTVANAGKIIRIPRSRRFSMGGMARAVNANYDSMITALTDGEGVLNRGATRRTTEANVAYANAGGTLVPARGGSAAPEIHTHITMGAGAQATPLTLRQIEEAAQRGVLSGLQTSGRYRDSMRQVLQ